MFLELLLFPTIILIYNILAYWYFQLKTFHLGFHIFITILPIFYILFQLVKDSLVIQWIGFFSSIVAIITTLINVYYNNKNLIENFLKF
jgi:hypothetical protein